MKNLLLTVVLLTALSSQAQPSPAAPVVSETSAFTLTNKSPATGAVFTNQTGQTFSVDQFATQLQNLRSAVETTLPMLAAFNQSASNSAGQNKSLTGRLNDIVSDALNKGGQTNSSGFNSVVGALRGLVSTNNNTSAGTNDAKAAQQLISLQNQLQPILRSLQELNVQGSPAPSGQPASRVRDLTPTGRQY